MAKSSRSDNRNSKQGGKKSTTHHTSDEVIKRHLSNEDDKITDADFENLKIHTSLPTDEEQQPLEIDDDKERPKDSEKDNKTITPWDVVSE